MMHHTRGIVFNYIKYRETSIIVRMYTEDFGSQSYIINGIRSAKAKSKIALYQPLTLLDLVVYHKPEKDLHRISEAKCSMPFQSIPFEPIKTGISIFLTEMLSKSVRHEAANPPLFEFMANAIPVLDHLQGGVENFHLQFLLKLTAYLGFKAESSEDFLRQLHDQGFHVSSEMLGEVVVDQLIFQPLGAPIKVGNSLRRDLLTHIVQFYRIHIESLGEIKSLEVLKEVLS